MKLLLVEDEVRIAGFLVKGLTAGGYDVEHVETGGEALRRAAESGAAYALVLLDLALPDMHGLDVLRRLREDGPKPPVIIYSANKGVREEGLRLGAADFLVKPLPFRNVLASVREHAGPAGAPP